MSESPSYPFLGQAGRILNSGQARTVLLTGNLHDLFFVPAPPRPELPEEPRGAVGADARSEIGESSGKGSGQQGERAGEAPGKGGGSADGTPGRATSPPAGAYLPIVDFLRSQWNVPGKILLVYELNGPIRFAADGDRQILKDAWLRWRTESDLDADEAAIAAMLELGRGGARPNRGASERRSSRAMELERLAETFDRNLQSAIGNPTVALELLRQLCLCSRYVLPSGRPSLPEDLIILIEAADMALPDGEVRSLSDADRRRLAICQDWFSDPGFLDARDSVVLLAESRSLLHHRLARLPQILEVEVPSPDRAARAAFIRWFEARHGVRFQFQVNENAHDRGSEDRGSEDRGSEDRDPDDRGSEDRSPGDRGLDGLAELTAGLTIHALAQLLKSTAHGGEPLGAAQVVAKVEQFVVSQLGEDVVEIKKPAHDLDDVVGFTALQGFLRSELIPRFREGGDAALPGAAVAGPIGSGKTFIFEAVATELDMVVVVLKNLRSQWFGQTDVIFERLRRVLEALSRVVIFVDEADTQFGGVGQGTHATERRLTGKIQQMMSDPRLRGRVYWLLMTARIHLLSPDIRRPGRVGDLIIPVLDPVADDRRQFLAWVLGGADLDDPTPDQLDQLGGKTEGYSAAAFAALRSRLKAEAALRPEGLDFEAVLAIVHDQLPADISRTRRYQTLQALLNCTRRRLLPDPEITDEERAAWVQELRLLEAEGIG